MRLMDDTLIELWSARLDQRSGGLRARRAETNGAPTAGKMTKHE